MTLHRIGSALRLSLAAAAVLMSPLTFAASTWSLSGCSSNGTTLSSTMTCTTSGGPTATLNGWSVVNGGAGNTFAAANLKYWSGGGLGVGNAAEGGKDATSPNHSMDNASQTDLIEFSFTSSIALSSVTVGWNNGGDADISVLRYTKTTAPTDIVGKTFQTLLADGWELVGNYGNLAVDTAKSVNTSNATSSWWLVSAYNSSFGAGGTNVDGGNDYMKVLSVVGNTVTQPSTGVPEPASMALVGIALFAMFGATRRQRGAVPSAAGAPCAAA